MYVYDSRATMFYSIHIEFFSQTQPFGSHIQNQITIKRLTHRNTKKETKTDEEEEEEDWDSYVNDSDYDDDNDNDDD